MLLKNLSLDSGESDGRAQIKGNQAPTQRQTVTSEGTKSESEGNHVPQSSSSSAAAETGHKKEKSVLQAKLTKLAIQIGYAGSDNYIL